MNGKVAAWRLIALLIALALVVNGAALLLVVRRLLYVLTEAFDDLTR